MISHSSHHHLWVGIVVFRLNSSYSVFKSLFHDCFHSHPQASYFEYSISSEGANNLLFSPSEASQIKPINQHTYANTSKPPPASWEPTQTQPLGSGPASSPSPVASRPTLCSTSLPWESSPLYPPSNEFKYLFCVWFSAIIVLLEKGIQGLWSTLKPKMEAIFLNTPQINHVSASVNWSWLCF